jgi:hydroxymethylpyrimidine/phosphomethylpyrimidine kinase / thiaminase
VLDDLSVNAIKTGMLFDAENTKAVVRGLRKHYPDISLMPPLICDPVCVSTSGHDLLHPDAVAVMISELFPLSTLITPNKSEAERLLSQASPQRVVTISSASDMISAAKELLKLGSKAVLLKGGHLICNASQINDLLAEDSSIKIVQHGITGSEGQNLEILQVHGGLEVPHMELVIDVLCDENGTVLFTRPRIDTSSTHGTGCTLSAAIAAELAHGSSCMLNHSKKLQRQI